MNPILILLHTRTQNAPPLLIISVLFAFIFTELFCSQFMFGFIFKLVFLKKNSLQILLSRKHSNKLSRTTIDHSKNYWKMRINLQFQTKKKTKSQKMLPKIKHREHDKRCVREAYSNKTVIVWFQFENWMGCSTVSQILLNFLMKSNAS